MLDVLLNGLERAEQIPARLKEAKNEWRRRIRSDVPPTMASVTPKGSTGRLARGWRASARVGGDVRVANTVVYARARNNGAYIVPKGLAAVGGRTAGHALRFSVGGRVVYAKWVRQRGTHFMEKGVEASRPVIERAFTSAFGNLFRR